MRKILMVCTGNTCRSAMAAAIFLNKAAERQIPVEVDSAGLSALENDPASVQAQTVMKEYGIDLSGHRAKQLDPQVLGQYDLILAMTMSHKQQILNFRPDLENKVFLIKEIAAQKMQETNVQSENLNRADSDVSDPYGQTVAVYQRTAAELLQAIEAILDAWQ
ncbi:MAG: low molecular weight protein arginine phosphatase [Firmicutes bacterium]|jgi:protein-tyrosine-phosphatase|nr:low molecular weight protein arginine phosphatase [Bacillota bacterium]NLL87930.1 low molecular weight protein arginine phosphatase [Bacillota bacterium]HKM17403.1 low molecular weight protein arginine phosphatase [Limnochordia bacterium]